MLDNDQQYTRAADLYKKYSEAVADKPQDSAQAYFFACNAYEKANDIAKYRRPASRTSSRSSTSSRRPASSSSRRT